MFNKLLIFAIFVIASGIIISCTDEGDTVLKEFNSDLEILDDQPSFIDRNSNPTILPVSGWNASTKSVCKNDLPGFVIQGGQAPYRWTAQGGRVQEQSGSYVGILVTGTSYFNVRVTDARGKTASLSGTIKSSCGSNPPKDSPPTTTPTPAFDIRIDVLSGDWNNSTNSICPKKKMELSATSGVAPFNWTIQGAKVLWRAGRSIYVEVSDADAVRHLTFRVVDGRGKVGELRGKVDPKACGICGSKTMKSSCFCNPCQKKCGGGEKKNCPEEQV